MTDPTATDVQYELAEAGFDGPVAWWSDAAAVEVCGADAQSFLQGQISADVVALAPAVAADTLVLEPSGHLVAPGWVIATDPHSYVLVVPGEVGDVVAARLERFRLRVDAAVISRMRRVLHVRGADVAAPAGGLQRRVHGGVDVLVDGDPEPGLVSGTFGAREIAPGDVDRVRVALGELAFGRDVQAGAIPAELGASTVARSASFDKGCYVGQELVARVESRGSRAPRRPCRVLWRPIKSRLGDDVSSEPFELRDGNSEVVGLMATDASIRNSADRRGLALVRRRVQSDDVVGVWQDGLIVGEGVVEVLEPVGDVAAS